MLNLLRNEMEFYKKTIQEKQTELQLIAKTDYFNGEKYTMHDADGYRMKPPKAIGEQVYIHPEEYFVTLEKTGNDWEVKATFDNWRKKNTAYALFVIENEESFLLDQELHYYYQSLQKVIEKIKRFEDQKNKLIQYKRELEYELQKPSLQKERIKAIDNVLKVYDGDGYVEDFAMLLDKI